MCSPPRIIAILLVSVSEQDWVSIYCQKKRLNGVEGFLLGDEADDPHLSLALWIVPIPANGCNPGQ